jgi:hypothetical protein
MCYALAVNGQSLLIKTKNKIERSSERRHKIQSRGRVDTDTRGAQIKYERYSENNLRLFLATNVGAGESSHMRGSIT